MNDINNTAEQAVASETLIAMMLRELRSMELTLTEATLKIPNQPEEATLLMATMVRDFRQMAGRLNEIVVNIKMAGEELATLRLSTVRQLNNAESILRHVGHVDG